jgi:hypothetical protein
MLPADTDSAGYGVEAAGIEPATVALQRWPGTNPSPPHSYYLMNQACPTRLMVAAAFMRDSVPVRVLTEISIP